MGWLPSLRGKHGSPNTLLCRQWDDITRRGNSHYFWADHPDNLASTFKPDRLCAASTLGWSCSRKRRLVYSSPSGRVCLPASDPQISAASLICVRKYGWKNENPDGILPKCKFGQYTLAILSKVVTLHKFAFGDPIETDYPNSLL